MILCIMQSFLDERNEHQEIYDALIVEGSQLSDKPGIHDELAAIQIRWGHMYGTSEARTAELQVKRRLLCCLFKGQGHELSVVQGH